MYVYISTSKIASRYSIFRIYIEQTLTVSNVMKV